MKNYLAAILVALSGLSNLGVAHSAPSAPNKIGATTVMTPGGKQVTVLPREISRSLDILRIPTQKPTPLLIGTYWHCFETENGHESCDIVLVVCTDDQEFCTTVP